MDFKPFLYYFVEDDGRVRQVVNKVVTSLNKKSPLPETPNGWQDIAIAWERNLKSYGNIRNFSFPLGFVRDAAFMLRNDAYKFNIDRKLFLLIQQFVCEVDNVFYKEYYKFFYKGELDFSTMKDKPGDFIVEMSIMEGGTQKLLTANGDTQYQIPFDEDAINILWTGIDLQKRGKFFIIDGIELDNAVIGGDWFAPSALINFEGQSAGGIAFTGQELEDVSLLTWDDKLKSVNWLAQASSLNVQNIDLHIAGKILLKCTQQDAANGLQMRFIRSNQLIGNQNDYQIINTGLAVGQFYSFDVNITIPLQPGERLYLEGKIGTTGVHTAIEFQKGSELNIDFLSKAASTFVKAFTPDVFFKKLAKKIFGTDAVVASEIFKTCSYAITCFDAIRGLDGAVISTTMNKFLNSYDIYLMGGWAVQKDILIFEERGYFFKYNQYNVLASAATNTDVFNKATNTLDYEIVLALFQVSAGDLIRITGSLNGNNGIYKIQTVTPTVSGTSLKFTSDKLISNDESGTNIVIEKVQQVVIPLGESKNFEIVPAIDLMGSSIKIGHQEQGVPADDINGKLGFCGFTVYETPIKRVKNEINLQADYKADCFEGEVIRINFEGKKTASDESNNDVFIADINRSAPQKFVDVTVSFIAALNLIIIPNGIPLYKGQKIKITGSANNDGTYTITGISQTVLLGQWVAVQEAVVDEVDAVVTIEILLGKVYELDRSVVPDDNGVLPSRETVFNVRLRPAALIKIHFPWLAGVLDGYETQKLKFASNCRNSLIKVAGVLDYADIDIATMTGKMFISKYFDFGTQVPSALQELLNDNPNSSFTTLWNSIEWEGFLWKAGIAPNTMVEQQFKLLCAPNNDLKKLIV